ncbi:serine/threonine-protein kinase CDG1 [Morus notabilis]|uniref:serine/threonine-protein kinase CDG1 n=1 Tax=Morus notabilis TaxID=981085 RepID=UPI000CED11D7|nr:serine/threonine-protein kinase CDG1 [Morus notabilis]
MASASPPWPSQVLIVYDATKERSDGELKRTVDNVRFRGNILRSGDTLVVIGILHTLHHPMGYPMKLYSENFMTSDRATEKEVSKKLDAYVKMLLESAEICKNEGVMSCVFSYNQISIEVKIIAGYPSKHVILQEVTSRNASWVLLDRHLRKEIQTTVIPCKFSFIQGDLTLEAGKFEFTGDPHAVLTEHKNFISLSKQVPVSISRRRGSKENNYLFRHTCSSAPILCITCGARTETYYIKEAVIFKYNEIQAATENFSKENLLGEGGYGHVYKGQLNSGQLIAAKVRKEESSQGFAEFHSEVYVLSFARHKNIVMLLGYCSKENINILVYEYICNKSLYWHLFDKEATPLEWHQRYAIAIGTAKGLRFLHEECRGGPIIHRDMRPSNILLTHDFIPMLCDFGLAKWKTSDDPVQTRILGTLGYLAPEYAENGIVSVRTDVYAYGIVLLQLISGRKVVIDVEGEEMQQSIRQWAEPILQRLALHELIDPRIENSHDTFEFYRMAKAAYSCVQRSPEMRPSMGEVVRLLEGDNDHFRHFGDQFIPHHSKE